MTILHTTMRFNRLISAIIPETAHAAFCYNHYYRRHSLHYCNTRLYRAIDEAAHVRCRNLDI